MTISTMTKIDKIRQLLAQKRREQPSNLSRIRFNHVYSFSAKYRWWGWSSADHFLKNAAVEEHFKKIDRSFGNIAPPTDDDFVALYQAYRDRFHAEMDLVYEAARTIKWDGNHRFGTELMVGPSTTSYDNDFEIIACWKQDDHGRTFMAVGHEHDLPESLRNDAHDYARVVR